MHCYHCLFPSSGNESAGTDNSTVTPTPPGTAGNESAGTDNSTLTPTPPGTAGNESAGTDNSTLTPTPPGTAGNESAGTDNSTATPTPPGTAGNESAETDNSTATPPSPGTAGKVFPGIITLQQTLSNIDDVHSADYENMVQNIIQFFKDAFENMADYKQTVIVKVDYTGIASSTRSGNNPVSVTVMNIFTEDTNETDADVEEAIRKAAENSNYVRQYTNCANCSAEANKFCDRQSGIPECRCMDNFKTDGEKCVRCPVGYSGRNCENNKELILIIVGTVFGAIILCLVAAVSVVSVRAKHSHDLEKKRLIKPGNSNSNNSEETRIFPRVQTTSGHANPGYQPNNPYEVRSSSRGDFVEKNYDDLVSVSHGPMGTVFLNSGAYEISRQPEGFRMQRR
ncbi:hypothetical protein CIB84_008342 [Bambusicola thoracicus]|uniref:SEA domain-containing protein n=1 Tax=Bambusicola thoracicus TaxID=9083 RepID=A0A2P4SUX4_BAMTH|nr:hypothetical protein CIB84_008342 [Bambusicola thoracicus]